MQRQKITVFGSFVADLTSFAPHLPARGETVFGGPFRSGPGGKGSNQGVAAQKAGADVIMITKLGKDAFADIALKCYKNAGIDTRFVFQDEKYETGAALIMVENGTGENCIVVSAGACGHITLEEVRSAALEIKTSKILLAQLETNLDAVIEAINIAKRYDVKVILNPAPVREIPDDLYLKIDILTPNETEACILSGIPVNDKESAGKAAEYFIQKGVGSVIITMGANGAFLLSDGFKGHIPAFRVDDVVDTTGAGDAFNGVLAAALAEGKDIMQAVVFANAAAAISITRSGTSDAMPDRAEINKFLTDDHIFI
jgi:ribokinase